LRAGLAERRAAALPGGDDLRAAASSCGEIARNMSGLVDDLLAISVARSGQSMLKFTPIEPAAIAEKAAELAEPLFAAVGLQLVVDISADLPVVQADVNRIQRVFTNLLDNARKFTDRGGQVVVRAEPAPGGVLFSVANSGAALRPEEMERMFQPFWQAGREDRRGAGLGLSICRSIIEAHGGSIWTEAESGMRVKIFFLLPTAMPKPGAPPLPVPQASLGLPGPERPEPVVK
jgi:signal transduction histidine kinase